jgi:hypothetical protein
MKLTAVATNAFITFVVLAAVAESRADIIAFTTDFNCASPGQFSGCANSIEGVQGYGGLGTEGNKFSGDFLRNSSSGNPATPTVLTLAGLPSHTGIKISFLLAVIDSWDGEDTASPFDPDFFNVRVDGNLIFSATFLNSSKAGPQGYRPAPGVELARRVQLGFNTDDFDHLDSAYDLGLDPTFGNIPHTSPNLTIEWFASGSGWQGDSDESWAIDNVQVRLLGTAVPEPSPLLLMLIASAGIIAATHHRQTR